MDLSVLQPALDAAVHSLPKLLPVPWAMQLHVRRAINEPSAEDVVINRFADAIKSVSEVSTILDQMQIHPGFATRFDLPRLVSWLLDRAKSTNSHRALADLAKFIDCDVIDCTHVLAIRGVTPAKEYAVSDDISFIPWDSLPPSQNKSILERGREIDFPFTNPTAALVSHFSIPKRFVPEDKLSGNGLNVPHTHLDDAASLLALLGPSAAETLAYWIGYPEWAPMLSNTMMFSIPEGTWLTMTFDNQKAEGLARLLSRFNTLDEASKSRIRIPISRLNSAKRRRNDIDAFIDLGIVLESIFLSDGHGDKGELSFRIQVRASRFIGRTPDDRAQIARLIRNAYTLRSIAVHTGTIPVNHAGKSSKEFLSETVSFTMSAVARLIETGQPDWNAIIHW